MSTSDSRQRDVRRWTRVATIHAAVCTRCHTTPDDDGGEWRGLPEQAIDVALELDWEVRNGALICDVCAFTEDNRDD